MASDITYIHGIVPVRMYWATIVHLNGERDTRALLSLDDIEDMMRKPDVMVFVDEWECRARH